jgi:hypothetical protein
MLLLACKFCLIFFPSISSKLSDLFLVVSTFNLTKSTVSNGIFRQQSHVTFLVHVDSDKASYVMLPLSKRHIPFHVCVAVAWIIWRMVPTIMLPAECKITEMHTHDADVLFTARLWFYTVTMVLARKERPRKVNVSFVLETARFHGFLPNHFFVVRRMSSGTGTWIGRKRCSQTESTAKAAVAHAANKPATYANSHLIARLPN